MNSKIIAVDFDGTLCENKWPEIGEPNEELIEYLCDRQKNGDKLILWTCRADEKLQKAVEWCEDKGLVFNAVNENLPEIIESFGSDTRKIFANEYIDDKNRNIASCHEKSNMELWAEREVRIACEWEAPDRKPDEWDYSCACYESALKAFRSLCEDGHSGFSIGMTKYILNRLIEAKPLTPIEDTENEWSDISERGGLRGEIENYQCRRMSSLFKYAYADGTVEYRDVNRFRGVNVDNPNVSYHSGLIDRVMEEKFPITMPYFPESKPFCVYCEEFLTDRKNGDFDTVGILYVVKPDGERIEINRYFKEGEKDFIEIDSCEYEMRREMYQEFLENLKKEQNKDCHGCFGAADNSCKRCLEENQHESE